MRGRMDGRGRVLVPLDPAEVGAPCDGLAPGRRGSAAAGCPHACADPAREEAVRDVIGSRPTGAPVSLCCEVSPRMGECGRFSANCVEAHVKSLSGR